LTTAIGESAGRDVELRGSNMKRVATPVAALLSFVLAAPALAATSGGISESFTVARTLALILEPPAVNYGAIAPDQLSSPVQIDVMVEFGGESGWDLEVSGSTSSVRTTPPSRPRSARARSTSVPAEHKSLVATSTSRRRHS
jgi:hypothetical protein